MSFIKRARSDEVKLILDVLHRERRRIIGYCKGDSVYKAWKLEVIINETRRYEDELQRLSAKLDVL